MCTLIHRRVAEARAGENPKVIRRLPGGWAVLGDVQPVRGYCLLLPDPVAPHLNAMPAADRQVFLADMTRLGDAVMRVTGCARINYEMLGNLEPALHAHVFPRYDDEPEDLRTRPIWFYDWDAAPPFCEAEHRGLMDAIGEALDEVPR